MMEDFHFLRPYWLWALFAVAAVVIALLRSNRTSRSWAAVCDPQLLPFLLEGSSETKRHRLFPWLIGSAGTLLIIALAGPTWERLPQPVFRDQSALVIALDLSRSMDAADLKPSRLTRAKHKITDILKARQDGQSALLVYAGDAFTVSPLTDDVDTILALLPSLDTAMMPAQGSRADHAIDAARGLLEQAGAPRGQVLLVTDGINENTAREPFNRLRQRGHRLSILGIGTEEGAPIPGTDGGFLKNRSGDIVMPRLDAGALQHWAQQGGGRYAGVRADDADIRYLFAEPADRRMDRAEHASGFETDQWREQGPWLILLTIPLVALAFRRGVLPGLLVLIIPMPDPVHALDWDSLWKRPDQQGMHALEAGDPQHAAEQFEDPQWKAAAQYRAGNYNQAATTLADIETPGALYNRGNALAKQGRFADAIASYQRSLELDPDHDDARHNLELLKRAQQQNQQQQQGQERDNRDDQQKNSQASQPQGDQPNGQQDEQNPSDDTGNESQGGQSGDKQQAESDPQSSDRGRQDQAQPEQSVQADAADDKQSADAEEPGENGQQSPEQQTGGEMNDVTAASEQHAEEGEVSANEQWLRRIPDDPGGLMRRKFRYQYQQREGRASREENPW